MVKFLRRVTHRHSKLGKGRKKKQIWRSPKGRHNKMRTKQKGNCPIVSIGYRTETKNKNKINEKIPVLIQNINQIKEIKKDNIVIIANVGKKKKIELLNELKDKGIEVLNVNIKKFFKKNKENKK